MADVSSGCHSLAGGQKDTNPEPRASLDPGVPCSGTPGRLLGRVTPRAVTFQYPRGGIFASVLSQNRSSKETELLSWREAVPTGELQLSVAKLPHCYFTVA